MAGQSHLSSKAPEPKWPWIAWILSILMYPLNKIAKYSGTLTFIGFLALILGNVLGGSLGVDNLFQDSQHLIDRAVTDGPLMLRNSPSFLTSLGLIYLCYLITLFARSSWHRAVFDTEAQHEGFWREILRIVPITLLVYSLLLSTWLFFGREVHRPCADDLLLADCGRTFRDNPRVAFGLGYEVARLAIGALVGLVLIFTTQFLIWSLRELIRRGMKLRHGALPQEDVILKLSAGHRHMAWNERIGVYVRIPKVWEYVCAILLVGGPVLAVFLLNRIVPALAVFAALGILYIVVRIYLDSPLVVRFLGAAIIVGLLCVPHDPFKLRFDGIPDAGGGSKYDKPLNLATVGSGITVGKDAGNRSARITCSDNHTRFEPLDPIEALKTWRDQQVKLFGREKPKLVLVATSGGAYRSAFWTAMILERLALLSNSGQRLAGFTPAIRVITGASGGMIGASYFTVLSRPFNQAPPRFLGEEDEAPFAKYFKRDLPVYSSPHTSIAATMNYDIRQSQRPDVYGNQNNFYRTRYPVPRDSLSPVVQHMLQVDLPSILWPTAVGLDRGKVLERQWRRLNRPFSTLRQGEAEGWRPSIIFSPAIVETGQPLVISNLDLSFLPRFDRREALSFFNLFPCAHGTFKLATAARMNATFPLISPAVSLPTIPERRVVDAGFYDNYGVSLAAAYLGNPEINDWVKENTSGVVVLQLRAFPLGTGTSAHCLKADAETDGGLLEGFEWITSPIEAVFSARGSTMVFRNEQELRTVARLYPEGFINTITFTNSTPVSMNWILPDDEAKAMRACLQEQWNDNIRKLTRVWQK